MIESGPPSDERTPVRGSAADELQVLYTEHWSLLATRSLTYSEIFSRVSIFIAILSGSVIALALVAQAAHFGATFISIAILMLTVVLFVGVTTVARLVALNTENMRWVSGMNRLRRAYLERNPGLEPYFITASHDDARGILLTMGFDALPAPRDAGSIFEGLQTIPGMVGVLVAVVAGALVGLIAIALAAPEVIVVLAAGGAFALSFLLFAVWSTRAFFRHMARLDVHFPRPKEP